jgi:hypothetical protein
MRTADGLAYLKARMLSLRIGLLWLLLFACAAPVAVFGLPTVALAAGLFILAFRLWDDLADLAHDRAHHSDRLLVRAPGLGPFRLARWVLLAILTGLLWALAGLPRALALLGLMTILAAGYGITDGRPALRPTRLALVLAKYPAFVLLLAGDPGNPLALMLATAAYLPPLIDEARGSGPAVLLPATLLLGLAAPAWLYLFPR